MGPAQSFRSPFGRVLAAGMLLVAVASLVTTAATAGLATTLATAGVPVLAATVTWVLFWLPELEVSDGGCTVRNVFRTIHVPWPCVLGVETTWALRLQTSDGPVAVWATPVGGVWAARRQGEPTSRTSAAAAARAVEDRWAALRDAGYLDGAPVQEVHNVITWHVGTIAALIALTGWVAFSAVAG